MKKSTIWIIVGIVAVLAIWAVSVNNKMVTKEEKVTAAWSQVENLYQRQADLIPQLVADVQGAAKFEIKAFSAVTEARSRAMAVNIDASNLTEENMAAFQQAQDELSSSITRAINVVREEYPQLQATQAFIKFQDQLEGTANRIAVERKKFNEVVNDYNIAIRRFPTSVVASILGFEKKGYFKASEGAERPAKVEFDF